MPDGTLLEITSRLSASSLLNLQCCSAFLNNVNPCYPVPKSVPTHRIIRRLSCARLQIGQDQPNRVVAKQSVRLRLFKQAVRKDSRTLWELLLWKDLKASPSLAEGVSNRSLYKSLRYGSNCQWSQAETSGTLPLPCNAAAMCTLKHESGVSRGVIWGGNKSRILRIATGECLSDELVVVTAGQDGVVDFSAKNVVGDETVLGRWGHTLTALTAAPHAPNPYAEEKATDGTPWRPIAVLLGGWDAGDDDEAEFMFPVLLYQRKQDEFRWYKPRWPAEQSEPLLGRRAFHSTVELVPGVLLVTGGLNVHYGPSTMLVDVYRMVCEEVELPGGDIANCRAGASVVFVPFTHESRNAVGRLLLMGGVIRRTVQDVFLSNVHAIDVTIDGQSFQFEVADGDWDEVSVPAVRCGTCTVVGDRAILWGGYDHADHEFNSIVTCVEVFNAKAYEMTQKPPTSSQSEADHDSSSPTDAAESTGVDQVIAREGAVSAALRGGSDGIFVFGGAVFNRDSSTQASLRQPALLKITE